MLFHPHFTTFSHISQFLAFQLANLAKISLQIFSLISQLSHLIRLISHKSLGPPHGMLGGERGVAPPVLADADLLDERSANVPSDLDEVQEFGLASSQVGLALAKPLQ